MKLISTYPGLEKLGLDSSRLQAAILERRAAIRYCRDQKGDDRCWLDLERLWPFIKGGRLPLTKPPSFAEMQRRCTEFFDHCREDKPDPDLAGAIDGYREWDADLEHMNDHELLLELYRLQLSIAALDDASRSRPITANDLRVLYLVLPEGLGADFRLPPREEFLGEAGAPQVGCPAFWRSHQKCSGSCDLHQWGPCRKAVHTDR